MNISIIALAQSYITGAAMLISSQRNSYTVANSKFSKFGTSFLFANSWRRLNFRNVDFKSFTESPIIMNSMEYANTDYIGKSGIKIEETSSFTNCVFSRCNAANSDGGAICAIFENGNIAIEQCFFHRCTCGWDLGAALCFHTSTDKTNGQIKSSRSPVVSVRYTCIHDCTKENGGQDGGCVYSNAETQEWSHCTFTDNCRRASNRDDKAAVALSVSKVTMTQNNVSYSTPSYYTPFKLSMLREFNSITHIFMSGVHAAGCFCGNMLESNSASEFWFVDIVNGSVHKKDQSALAGIFRIGCDPNQIKARLAVRHSNFYNIDDMILLGDCDSTFKVPQTVEFDSCKTDIKGNPSLTEAEYQSIGVNPDNKQYCQIFTNVFTASNIFSASHVFSESHKFTPSKAFKESKKFTQSKPFDPSHEFTNSHHFTYTDKFTQSNFLFMSDTSSAPVDDGGLSKSAVIGLSVACVVIVLLVVLTVFLCCLLKRSRDFSSSPLEFNSQMYQGMESGTAQKMLINDVNLSSGPRTMSNSLFSGKSSGDISDDPFRRDIEEMD